MSEQQDMGENRFWLRVWIAPLVAICVLIVSVSGCMAHRNGIKREVIKDAADPVSMACAVGLGGDDAYAKAYCLSRR